MKYKRFRTLFLIAAISLPTASINSSDYFSMANLQNIGTNIFAIPGSIGQFLQIDRLLSSIAPSLWNSYEAHEQRTITGVVTTLVGVIIAILLHASKPQSSVSTPIEDPGKQNIINQIIKLASTIEKEIAYYSKKLDEKSIFTSQELNQLDQTIQNMQNNLNNIIKPFKILGIDNEIQDIKTTETLIDNLKNLYTKLYDLRLQYYNSKDFLWIDYDTDKEPQKNPDIPELDLLWLKRIASMDSTTTTIVDHVKKALDAFLRRLNIFAAHIKSTSQDIMQMPNDKIKTLESHYPLRKAQYEQFKQTYNQFIQNIYDINNDKDINLTIFLINKLLNKDIPIDLNTINTIYDFKQLSKNIDSFDNDLWKIVEQMPTMQKNSLDNVIRFLPQFQEKYNKFKQKLDALKNNPDIIHIDISLSHNQDAIDVFNESIDSMQKALNSIDLGLKGINEFIPNKNKMT